MPQNLGWPSPVQQETIVTAGSHLSTAAKLTRPCAVEDVPTLK
jgi:hypothetical protein